MRAAGWHCPVCGRTSTLGEPRERPCPRCIRRSRIDYDRWDDLGRRWRRLHRKLRELDRVATVVLAAPLARVPRRRRRPRPTPAARVESLNATIAALDAALAAAEAGVAESELRVAAHPHRRAAPSAAAASAPATPPRPSACARPATARPRVLDEQRLRVVELDRERTRLERELRARHESSERARRHGQAKRDAERAAALRELRTIEIELGRGRPGRDRAAGRLREPGGRLRTSG